MLRLFCLATIMLNFGQALDIKTHEIKETIDDSRDSRDSNKYEAPSCNNNHNNQLNENEKESEKESILRHKQKRKKSRSSFLGMMTTTFIWVMFNNRKKDYSNMHYIDICMYFIWEFVITFFTIIIILIMIIIYVGIMDYIFTIFTKMFTIFI